MYRPGSSIHRRLNDSSIAESLIVDGPRIATRRARASRAIRSQFIHSGSGRFLARDLHCLPLRRLGKTGVEIIVVPHELLGFARFSNTARGKSGGDSDESKANKRTNLNHGDFSCDLGAGHCGDAVLVCQDV